MRNGVPQIKHIVRHDIDVMFDHKNEKWIFWLFRVMGSVQGDDEPVLVAVLEQRGDALTVAMLDEAKTWLTQNHAGQAYDDLADKAIKLERSREYQKKKDEEKRVEAHEPIALRRQRDLDPMPILWAFVCGSLTYSVTEIVWVGIIVFIAVFTLAFVSSSNTR